MVRGPTPDVVLTGVALLARGASATSRSSTSAAPPPTCTRSSRSTRGGAGLAREVVAPTPVTRTVEGDLGMRWSAVSTVEEAELLRPRGGRSAPARRPRVPAHHRRRARRRTRRSPGPRSPWRCAGTPVARGSWSAPTAGSSSAPASTCARSTWWSAPAGCCATADPGWPSGCSGAQVGADGDWQLPERRAVVVDTDYVLVAAGLLAADHPDAAYRLVTTLLVPTSLTRERPGRCPGAVRTATEGGHGPSREARRHRGSPTSGPAMRRHGAPSPSRSRSRPATLELQPRRGAVRRRPGRRLVVAAARHRGRRGVVLGYLISFFAVMVIPVAIALLITALVVPVVDGLVRQRRAAAASAGGPGRRLHDRLVVALLTFAGQQVANGASDLADQTVAGLEQIQDWLRDGPLNASDSQINKYIESIQDAITEQSGRGRHRHRSPRSAPRSATCSPASSSCCSRPTSSWPTATGSGPGWSGSRPGPLASAWTARAGSPGSR